MKNNRKNQIILALMVVFTAAAMRAPMGSVGPLIGSISADLKLSSSVAGFLNTIPLLIFAITAPLAGKISSKYRPHSVLYGSIAVIAAGLLLRSYGGIVGLFGGTVLLGLGIGVLNVFMPALVRSQFAKIGLMMGVFTAAMTGASALSAGTSKQLEALLGSWNSSMAFMIILPAAAFAFSIAARKILVPRFPTQEGEGGRYRVWTLKNIAIALYLGLQSMLFFALLTWLPTIVENAVPSYKNAGMLVLAMQVIGLVPSLLVPAFMGRLRHQGTFTCLSTLPFIAGFLSMLLWPSSAAAIIIATVCFGLTAGASISISMTLIAMQGSTAAETARASAFIQCISSVVGAIGPSGAGWLFDRTGDWKAVLIGFIVLSIAMAAIGGYAGRNKPVSDLT